MVKIRKITSFLNSLVGRMALYGLVINVTLIPLLIGGLLFVVNDEYQEQFVRQAQTNARLIAALLAQDPSKEMLEGVFNGLRLSAHVVYARIALHSEQRSIPGLTDPALKQGSGEDLLSSIDQHSVYHTNVPIATTGGEPVATLQLGFNRRPTQEMIDSVYQHGLYLAIGYIILSLALFTLFALHISRPLQHLRAAIRRIATEDSDKHLDIATGITEFTQLGQAVESMHRKLVKQGQMLKHEALHDSLTGLPNRTLLHDRVQQALLGGHRAQRPVALFMLDLNRFKEVNDSFGHHMGDLLLQRVAGRIGRALRKSDTVARLGGDEFVILLPTVANDEQAALAAKKILKLLEKPILVEGQTLSIGASIGITLFPRDGEDSETLLRRADEAMYQAKRTCSGFAIYPSS